MSSQNKADFSSTRGELLASRGFLFPSDSVNWKSYGMDPTGVADSTSGLQAYVDAKLAANPSIPSGGGNNVYPDIVLPPGFFKITSTIDLSGTTAANGKCGLRGAPGGTMIFGNINGYLVKKSSATLGVGPSYIKDIHFINNNTTPWDNAGGGSGVFDIPSGQGLLIKDCSFVSRGGVCINMRRTGALANVYGCAINGCLFTGAAAASPSQTPIGIIAHGQTSIVGCDFTVFAEAMRLDNATYFIGGNRFEINLIAFNLGTGWDGSFSQVSNIVISGFGMEANDTPIWVRGMNTGVIQGGNCNSHAGGPNGNGQWGMKVDNATNSVIQSIHITGAYTAQSIILGSGAKNTFINVDATNSVTPTAAGTWNISGTNVAPTRDQFINCTYRIGTTIYPMPLPLTRTLTGSTTLLINDEDKLLLCNKATAFNLNLPAPGTLNPLDGVTKSFMDGYHCDIRNIGAGTVTLLPTSSTINGLVSITLATNASVRLFSDGANWWTTT